MSIVLCVIDLTNNSTSSKKKERSDPVTSSWLVTGSILVMKTIDLFRSSRNIDLLRPVNFGFVYYIPGEVFHSMKNSDIPDIITESSVINKMLEFDDITEKDISDTILYPISWTDSTLGAYLYVYYRNGIKFKYHRPTFDLFNALYSIEGELKRRNNSDKMLRAMYMNYENYRKPV